MKERGFEVRSSVKAMPQHRPSWMELLSLKNLYFRIKCDWIYQPYTPKCYTFKCVNPLHCINNCGEAVRMNCISDQKENKQEHLPKWRSSTKFILLRQPCRQTKIN